MYVFSNVFHNFILLKKFIETLLYYQFQFIFRMICVLLNELCVSCRIVIHVLVALVLNIFNIPPERTVTERQICKTLYFKDTEKIQDQIVKLIILSQ